jgi:hypothetical protein
VMPSAAVFPATRAPSDNRCLRPDQAVTKGTSCAHTSLPVVAARPPGPSTAIRGAGESCRPSARETPGPALPREDRPGRPRPCPRRCQRGRKADAGSHRRPRGQARYRVSDDGTNRIGMRTVSPAPALGSSASVRYHRRTRSPAPSADWHPDRGRAAILRCQGAP